MAYCIKTYDAEDVAKAATSELESRGIRATYDYSEFVEKWCVRVVNQDDARAAYNHLQFNPSLVLARLRQLKEV